MSVSAEYVALANQAVLRTFEQTCVAWKALPHWDTRNPGQARVRSDVVSSFADDPDAGHDLSDQKTSLIVTLAQATAETPDPLLGAVIAASVTLAGLVDADVLPALAAPATTPSPAAPEGYYTQLPSGSSGESLGLMLGALLNGRELLEDHGYRADSCLLVSTPYHRLLNQLVNGELVADQLLQAGAVGAAHRASALNNVGGQALMLMVGRRQEMAEGSAAHASAGEEPADLAVSVAPSLEVVGETADGKIELTVRVRYALRLKDDYGVVVFHDDAPSPLARS